MLSTNANDVKIYNLSAGKSLPEWITEKKRRKLEKKDIDIRRRIELIQDFSMPDVSNVVAMSPDQNYILAAGTYKPRIRCYEVNNLSMKFERCLDAEVIKMLVLSEGYEKLVFLEEERYVEFHARFGHYFRIRIPKFGRDIGYHDRSCDLYIVGSGPDIYRLNLEQGRFMEPLMTEGSSLTACQFNPEHQLFVVGTYEGKIEAWDPRVRRRVGVLDCALDSVNEGGLSSAVNKDNFPTTSAIKFKNALQMAVGTTTGQTLIYDIRSNKPLLVKDQQNDIPIKDLAFVPESNLVASLDSKVVKFWDENSGKPYAAIEPGPELNNMCLVPNSGLMFLSNENTKIMSFYVPNLGPAPKWCSFLDNITEELEETDTANMYDDYKFVSQNELGELGLEHLVGTNLLRSYMHGYFMDLRLYQKAKTLINPFAYDNYKKQKIREKLDEERDGKVIRKQRLGATAVNADLAKRLIEDEAEITASNVKKKKKEEAKMAASILEDDRFGALFKDSAFEIDPNSEEYRMLDPAIQKLQRSKDKRNKKASEDSDNESIVDDEKNIKQNRPSTSSFVDGDETNDQNDMNDSDLNEDDEGDSSSDDGDTSDDNDEQYKEDMRQTHQQLRRERYLRERQRLYDEREERRQAAFQRHQEQASTSKIRIESKDKFGGWNKELSDGGQLKKGLEKMPLGARANVESADGDDNMDENIRRVGSGREMTFTTKKRSKAELKSEREAEHIRERRKSRRSAGDIVKKLKKPPTLNTSSNKFSSAKRKR